MTQTYLQLEFRCPLVFIKLLLPLSPREWWDHTRDWPPFRDTETGFRETGDPSDDDDREHHGGGCKEPYSDRGRR